QSQASLSSTATGGVWSVGVGLSALVYLTKSDLLRTYVSPRIGFSRANATTVDVVTFVGQPPTTSASSAKTNTYSASGSVGAQYDLGRRFAVFGEIGFAFSDNETGTTLDNGRFDASGKTISLRSGAGVILFF
ncbi:MAG TPA: hypothetical protein VFA59_18735, partial [Vicinamibacterales bacterium]|nr:hypothetical protein [Vicinamibacterales bacterium]